MAFKGKPQSLDMKVLNSSLQGIRESLIGLETKFAIILLGIMTSRASLQIVFLLYPEFFLIHSQEWDYRIKG